MGLADRLKEAAKKAEEAAGERKGQIREAVHKVETVADQRTGGRYSEKIQKAAAKADDVVDRLKDPAEAAAPAAAAEGPPAPAAEGPPAPAAEGPPAP
jgi:DNA-binding protein H-NS